VVLALGADVQIGFQVSLPDGLAAVQAFGSQAFRSNASSAGNRAAVAAGIGLVFAMVSLEPGHADSHSAPK
jgi:hypothetical protein